MKTQIKKQIEKCADCEHCDTGFGYTDKFFCLAMNKQTCPYNVLPKWCPLPDYNDKADNAELLAALEEIAKQKLPAEFEADGIGRDHDYEYGYESIVNIARDAIAKHKAGKEG